MNPFRRKKRRPERPAEFADDDFDWRRYEGHYRTELKNLSAEHSQRIRPGDYAMEGGQLNRVGDILPLHPNHRLLYETIVQLAPASVVELGCGGGDHLHCLELLLPDTQFHGFDRSPEQLGFLRERNPDVRATLELLDATMPYSRDLPTVDVGYTQAVFMHIQTGNGHRVAMANLFHMATKQVVLMENWSRHDFVADIRELFERRMIPWTDLHLYFRRAPELANRPHMLVASSIPLEYEELESDAVLR